MAGPRRQDDLLFPHMVLIEGELQSRPNAVDVAAQKIEVARIPEIIGAAADEIHVIDVVARVIGGEKSLDLDIRSRRLVAEGDPQARNPARPSGVPEDRDHRAGRGVVLRRSEHQLTVRAELRMVRSRPLNPGPGRAETGGPPSKLEKRRLCGIDRGRRRQDGRAGPPQRQIPSVSIDALVVPALKNPSRGGDAFSVVRAIPAGRALEREMPAPAAKAVRPDRKGPAHRVGEIMALVGVDVAVRVDAAGAQLAVPSLHHTGVDAAGLHSRNKKKARQPFIPQRGLGSGRHFRIWGVPVWSGVEPVVPIKSLRNEMLPGEVPQQGHLPLEAGNAKSRKIGGNHPSSPGRPARVPGRDEPGQEEHGGRSPSPPPARRVPRNAQRGPGPIGGGP